MDGSRKEDATKNAQELSMLRKKATEFILQSNYKAALSAFEEALDFTVKHPDSLEELKLTTEDLYILNCARCLCYVQQDVDKAEEILSDIESSFEFKLPMLYFMFAREYFRKKLLDKVEEYAEKFLAAYRENLFSEKGKTYYWIGTSIPIKYEQFNCSISDLANEVLESMRRIEITNDQEEEEEEGGGGRKNEEKLLTDIFTTLEEVIFYTQTEDSIRISFSDLGSVHQENNLFAMQSSDKVSLLLRGKTKELEDDIGYVCENKQKGLDQCTQTYRLKFLDAVSQTKTSDHFANSAVLAHSSVQTEAAAEVASTKRSSHAQTEVKKKSNAQVQVIMQTENDVLMEMKGKNENFKDQIASLELQLQEKDVLIERQKDRFAKFREENVIETTKMEVRLEILQSELSKLQQHHETDLKQIATLEAHLKNSCIRNSNLQLNIYSQYEKKCNTMIKDLTCITQYLTQCSIPTISECNEELKMWKDELCKTIYCKQLIYAYQEELRAESLKASCYNMPNLPDIPDCPIEARDLLHESFKPTMLHIIKNENMTMNNVNPVKPVSRPPTYLNNNAAVPQTQYGVPQFYLQGPNITYYRPMSNNFPPGFTNPFQQPTIFPSNVGPIQPPPNAQFTPTKNQQPHQQQVHQQFPGTPSLQLREPTLENNKSFDTRSGEASSDRQSLENSSTVTSPSSNTPSVGGESHSSSSTENNNNFDKDKEKDCRSGDLNMMSVSDIERQFNIGVQDDAEEEKPLAPPLSSLMRLNRKKNGVGPELNKTEKGSNDLLNLNCLTRPPDAVLALGGKSFPIVYLYVKKNIPEVGEEQLIQAINIVKEKNDGRLDNLKQEEILARVKAVFKENKTRSLMRTAWDMAESFCSICNKGFMKDQKTVMLGCKHKFHEECIKVRLETRNACPNCHCYIALNDEYPPLTKVWAN